MMAGSHWLNAEDERRLLELWRRQPRLRTTGIPLWRRLSRWFHSLPAVPIALLAIGTTGPDSCVSRERVEACESACAERGGYTYVITAKSSVDCICADWAFVAIGGGDA